MTAIDLRLIYRLIALFVFLSLSACDNGSNSSSAPPMDTPEDTGTLSFAIDWKDDPQEAGTISRAGIDCTGRDVATIEATIYNSENEVIATRAWPCDAHTGTIDVKPVPQDEAALLLVGKNNNGNIAYRGVKSGLSIKAGTDNDAGVVDVFRFVPPAVTPADAPNSIQWKSVPGATVYRVAISESEDFSELAIDDLMEVCDGEECTYTASGLTAGMVHFVRIYARDANGIESEGSESASFTTLVLSPVPQDVTATGDLNMISINWEAESGIRYNIYWSTTAGVTTTAHEGKLEDIESLPHVHTNLQGNTTYYYVVTAENSLGQESAISAEVSATAVGNPMGPENVSATARDRNDPREAGAGTTSEITLNWTAVEGFVYNIYWATEPGVSKSEYLGKFEGIDAGTFVHADCEGRKHYYIVTAANDLGESDPIGEVSAAPGWFELLVDEVYANDESSKAIVVDNDGNSYVIGSTMDDFEDQRSNGSRDIIIVKSDFNGARQWAKLIGTTARDNANSIGVDDAGNFYVVGTTCGDWDDYVNPYEGGLYIFIMKFNAQGERVWTSSMPSAAGDLSSSLDEKPYAYITVDPEGNSVITGNVERTVDEIESVDSVIAKYDTDGTQQWVQYLSSPEDEESHAITLDAQGNVFVTGVSSGDLDGQTNSGLYDIFVAKFSAAGEKQWVTLHGNSESNLGSAVAVDQEFCYVSGRWGMQFGWEILGISQFKSEDGVLQWSKTIDDVRAGDIALGPNGNLITVGHTRLYEFDGQQNAGEGEWAYDILLMEYDADGERLWSKLFGTTERDFGYGIFIDADGYAHITGDTQGDLGGQDNSGRTDMFNWKFHVEP